MAGGEIDSEIGVIANKCKNKNKEDKKPLINKISELMKDKWKLQKEFGSYDEQRWWEDRAARDAGMEENYPEL